MSTLPQSFLDKAFEALLRGDGTELDAYLHPLLADEPVVGTSAKSTLTILRLDGTAMPRVDDLAHAIAFRMTEYVIPRTELRRVSNEDRRKNTHAGMSALRERARSLFVRVGKTGEGGELLLYMLAQGRLRLPQLFCKMSLKTSGQVHVHGADGLHFRVCDGQPLQLYWGEAKMYADLTTGVRACLDGLQPFLCRDSSRRDERDLQLVRDNIDLENQEIQDAVLAFLDRDNPQFNVLEYHGLGLVGYNHDAYPKSPYSDAFQDVCNKFGNERDALAALLKNEIATRAPLDRVHIHMFLVPFPSVQAFRDAFLKVIGG